MVVLVHRGPGLGNPLSILKVRAELEAPALRSHLQSTPPIELGGWRTALPIHLALRRRLICNALPSIAIADFESTYVGHA